MYGSDLDVKSYDINRSGDLPNYGNSGKSWRIFCSGMTYFEKAGSEKVWIIPKGKLMPDYPYEMRLRAQSGSATVRYSVRNGKVYNLFISAQSNPLFGVAAVSAVKTWSFEKDVRELANGETTFDFCFGGGAPSRANFFSIGVMAYENVLPASESNCYPMLQPIFDYPEEWRAIGLSGFALVKVFVTPNNTVEKVQILSSSTEAIGLLAEKYCLKWTYIREIPVKKQKKNELVYRLVCGLAPQTRGAQIARSRFVAANAF
jgi:hypothetical protein